MFRDAIQRCLLVLLLVARLALGTAPVHAIPVASMTEAPGQLAHCHEVMDPGVAPEHHAMSHHVDSAPAHLTAKSDSKQDCCKHGTCECPGAHVSVINLSVRSEAYRYVVSVVPSVDSQGRTDPTLDRLFRPPA